MIETTFYVIFLVWEADQYDSLYCEVGSPENTGSSFSFFITSCFMPMTTDLMASLVDWLIRQAFFSSTQSAVNAVLLTFRFETSINNTLSLKGNLKN